MSDYTHRIRMGHAIDAGRVTFAPNILREGDALHQFEAEIARIVAEETAGLRAEVERLTRENARLVDAQSPTYDFAAELATYRAGFQFLLAMGGEDQYVVIRGGEIVGLEPTLEAALELKYRACGRDVAMVMKVTETEEIIHL